ncbi:MAG: hypothetical protein J0M08_00010 [Bacteroidetes bacterium]|nr:hypothetical protein [Bacteroidota bacterium]
MKTTIKLLTLISFLAFISCKKNDVGGKATIHAEIFHHEQPINGAVVYIKFGTQELPSDPENNYDLKVTGEDSDNHVHIDNMRPGEYYLYAVGFDAAISMPVKGGVPVKIKWSDRKKMTEVNIPVTE